MSNTRGLALRSVVHLAVFLLSVTGLFAQQHDCYVPGKILTTKKRPIATTITATAIDTADTSFIIRADVQRKGRFEMFLPWKRVYRLYFEAEGYVGKHILIDLKRNVHLPIGDRGLQFEIELPERLESVDYSLLSEPIGIVHFEAGADEPGWDLGYSERRRPLWDAFQVQYDLAMRKRRSHRK